MGDHRVARDTRELHARGRQRDLVVLDVVVPLLEFRILEDWLQSLKCGVGVQLRVLIGCADRQVVRLLRLPRERVADDLRLQRVEAGRFEVEDEPLLLLERREERLEGLG